MIKSTIPWRIILFYSRKSSPAPMISTSFIFTSTNLHFPFSRRQDTAHLTTLHGRLDLPDLNPLHKKFREIPVVSISNAQRLPMAWANWQGTVYHGLPLDLYQARSEPGEYLVFLGRICAKKRFDRAVEIAKRAKMPLKFAAKVEDANREYFEQTIKSADGHAVEGLGEVDEAGKQELLANAYALHCYPKTKTNMFVVESKDQAAIFSVLNVLLDTDSHARRIDICDLETHQLAHPQSSRVRG